jgi:integrase
MANSIRNIVGKAAFMFRKMHKQGYEVDFSFEDVKLKKERSTAVYLTTSEIECIYRLYINRIGLQTIRDLFIIACCTGLRFSDLSKLTNKNAVGNKIVIKTQKTGETVEIPRSTGLLLKLSKSITVFLFAVVRCITSIRGLKTFVRKQI